MATMDPGQRGFGQRQRFNIPNLPFAGAGGAPPGGMPPRGPAGAGNAPFIDQIQRLFPQGQIPPELLQMLMARLMAGQGGGGRPLAQRNPKVGPQMPQRMPPPRRGGATPMPTSPPMPPGGRRATPMPSRRMPPGGRRATPMPSRPGGGRPPVVRMDDLLRALSGGGGGASQADLPVPQARR